MHYPRLNIESVLAPL
jgi:SAM-dependent methyltransferase